MTTGGFREKGGGGRKKKVKKTEKETQTPTNYKNQELGCFHPGDTKYVWTTQINSKKKKNRR